jgi:hypothetical protein
MAGESAKERNTRMQLLKRDEIAMANGRDMGEFPRTREKTYANYSSSIPYGACKHTTAPSSARMDLLPLKNDKPCGMP